jgi:hypothetical protein
MTEFVFLAEAHRERDGADDLVGLSFGSARTPCGPLRSGHGFPDRELKRWWNGYPASADITRRRH